MTKKTRVDYQERAYQALLDARDDVVKAVCRVSPDPVLASAHCEYAISKLRAAVKAIASSRKAKS